MAASIFETYPSRTREEDPDATGGVTTPPATAPAVPAATGATSAAEPAPSSVFESFPSRSDPAKRRSTWSVPPPAAAPAPTDDAHSGFLSNLGIGAKQGTIGAIEDAGEAGVVLNRKFGGDPNSKLGAVGKTLSEYGGPDQPAGISIADVWNDPSKATSYAGRTIASGVTSTVPSLVGGIVGAQVGGVAGAGAGSVIPGVGTAAGGVAGEVAGGWVGAGLPALVSGIGGASKDLKNDPEVAKALKEGKITQDQLDNYALGAGMAIGALDMIPTERWSRITGIGRTESKALTREALLTVVKKGIKEGVLYEGPTEAAQAIISHGAQVYAGGAWDLAKRGIDVIDQYIGGAAGGTTVGGAATVYGNQRKPKELPPGGSSEQPAGGDTKSTVAAPPGSPGVSGTDPAAPGGTSAAQKTQPTGVPPVDKATGAAAGTAGAEAAKAAPAAAAAPAAGGPTVLKPGEVDPAVAATGKTAPAAPPIAPDVSRETTDEEVAGAAPDVLDQSRLDELRRQHNWIDNQKPIADDAAAAINATTTRPEPPPTQGAAVNQPRPEPTITPPAASVAQPSLPVGEQPAVQAPPAPPSPGPELAGAAIPPQPVSPVSPAAAPSPMPGPADYEHLVTEPIYQGEADIGTTPPEWGAKPLVEPEVPPAAPQATKAKATSKKRTKAPRGKVEPGTTVEAAPQDEAAQAVEAEAPPAPTPAPQPQQAPEPAAEKTQATKAQEILARRKAKAEETKAKEAEKAKAKSAEREARKRALGEREIEASRERIVERPAIEEPLPTRHEPGPFTQNVPDAATTVTEEAKPTPTKEEPAVASPEQKAKETSKRRKPQVVTFERKPKAEAAVDKSHEREAKPEQKPDLEGELRRRVNSDMVDAGFTHPGRREQAIERAMQARKSGMTYAEIVDKAKREHANIEEEIKNPRLKREAEAKVEAERVAAAEAAAEARKAKAATPQKTTRGDTKSAEDIRGETPVTTRNRAAKEPVDARTEGGKLAMEGKIAAAREWYAQQAEKREQAGQATPEEQVEKEVERRKLTVHEREYAQYLDTARAARAEPEVQKREEQAKAAVERAGPIPQPRTSNLDEVFKAIKGWAKGMTAGITTIPKQMGIHQPPYTNLLVLAKKVANPKNMAGEETNVAASNALGRFAEGYGLLVRDGDVAGFERFVASNDAMSKAQSEGAGIKKAIAAPGEEVAESDTDIEDPEANIGAVNDVGESDLEEAQRIALENQLDSAEATDQDQVDAAPEITKREPDQRIATVSGGYVTIPKSRIFSAEDALNDPRFAAPKEEGDKATAWTKLMSWLDKQLSDHVGGVDVYLVTPEEMAAITGAPSAKLGMFGSYSEPSTAVHKADPEARSYILVNQAQGVDTGSGRQMHLGLTLRHELVHSASVVAQLKNAKFAKQILEIRKAAWDAMSESERKRFANVFRRDEGVPGGEFLADAFVDPELKRFLQNTVAPDAVVQSVAGSLHGVKATLWSRIVDSVRTIFGAKTADQANLLDQLMQITPHFLRTREQVGTMVRAGNFRADIYEPLNYRAIGFAATYKGAKPEDYVARQTEMIIGAALREVAPKVARSEAKSARAWRGFADKVSDWTTKVLTNEQIVQNGKLDGTWKTDENYTTAPQRRLMAQERVDTLAREIAAGGRELAEAHNTLMKEKPELQQPVTDAIFRATNEEVDLTSPKAPRTKRQKAVHDELHREFKSWPQEVQDHVVAIKKHFEEMQNRYTKANLVALMQEAKTGTFPAGMTTPEQQADWIMGGGIGRAVEDIEAKKDTDDAKAYKALGKNLADDLDEASSMNRVKGFYFPLSRVGAKHVVAGHEEVNVPPGAELVPGTTNLLRFKDAKAAKAYRDDPNNGRSSLRHVYYDLSTGKRAKASSQDPNIVRTETLVRVKNEYVEFFDNWQEAKQKRDELIAGVHGGKFTDQSLGLVETKNESFFNGTSEFAPRVVRRINDRIDQRGDLSEGQKTMLKAEFTNAAIRQMQGTSIRQRHLQRRGVRGHDTSIQRGLVDYNVGMGNAVARFEMHKEINDAEKDIKAEMDEGANDRSKDAERLNNARRRHWEQLQRSFNNPYRTGSKNQILQNVYTLTFLKFLGSVKYTVANLSQPGMTGARIASQFGHGRAAASMMHAYRIMGAGRTLGRGLGATGRAIVGGDTKVPYFDQIKQRIARGKYKYKAGVIELIEKAEALGRVDLDIAGIEYEQRLSGKKLSPISAGINHLGTIARQLPKAAEAVNRTVSMIATYDAAMRSGKHTHAQAMQLALDVTSATQFDYRPENAPAIMNHPGTGFAFMFKKFGQGYLHLTLDALRAVITRPGQRRQAAKLFANLAIFNWFFAGLQGALWVEPVKMALWLAHKLGLKDDDDNWDEYMLSLRKWFAKNNMSTLGSLVVKGPVYTAGVDMSKSISADSILLFNEMKEDTKEGFWSMVGQLVGGGPGSFLYDAYSSIDDIKNGQWAKALGKLVPVKQIADMAKGWQAGVHGPTSPTGKSYAPPISTGAAVAKGLGFKPSSESDREALHFNQAAQDKEIKDQRNYLIGKHTNAPDATAKAKAVSAIREWNKEHPKKGEKITDDSLKRSRTGAKTEEKKRRAREHELEAAL